MDLTRHMKLADRKRRQEHTESIPWITHLLDDDIPCDGIRWNEVPLKALYRWGPNRQNPPIGLDKYKCKKLGRWEFEALPEYEGVGGSQSGIYCWDHLLTQILNSYEEHERYARWLETQ